MGEIYIMRRLDMKIYCIIFSAITLIFAACGNNPSDKKDVEAAATAYYAKINRIQTQLDEAIALHVKGDYKGSNKILLKMYTPGHSGVICHYLFLNYGMMGDYKNAREYFEEWSAQCDPGRDLKSILAAGKYANIFKDEYINRMTKKIIEVSDSINKTTQ